MKERRKERREECVSRLSKVNTRERERLGATIIITTRIMDRAYAGYLRGRMPCSTN